MAKFEYDHNAENAEYYETLQNLMERWENEIVEFKEAKGQYSEEKIGQYFSAISNEANLSGKQYGWFVLGVSENNEKHPVGTAFKQGNAALLEKVKYTIGKDLTDNMTFLDIIELFPKYEGKTCRVLMFKIPAAVAGMPTEWKGRCYGRDGDSLVALQQYKIDAIRGQERQDWSKRIVNGATIAHLDSASIAIARQKYKEKMGRPHITEEVDAMSDEEFLTKLRLIQNGNVTNAAMVLLGKEESDFFFETPPKIMWRLIGQDGQVKDYVLFGIPFINVIDKVLEKVRFLTYRYMPNRKSLFPKEVIQYDNWILRELLCNCIAHSNYQIGGRIYVNEFENHLTITNPGTFIPKNIRSILKPGYNPPFYKNPLLASSMTNFRMIDTATSGIKKMFRIQKERFFPLPDYETFQNYQVVVKVYGQILNNRYTHILFDRQDLDLETVYLLDLVQKGKEIAEQDRKVLRDNLFLREEAGQVFLVDNAREKIVDDTERGKKREYTDKDYKEKILKYLYKNGPAQKKDLRDLLWDILPDYLTETQKNTKIRSLLDSLRNKGLIEIDAPSKRNALWRIVKIK